MLHAAEAGLDDPGPFVSESQILGRQAVVDAGDHELAVERRRGLDLGGIEPGPAAPIGAQVAAMTA